MRPAVNKVRLVILIALLFSTLCAAVFRTTPILFMAALLCGAPFIGFLLTRLSSRSLKIVQTLPETGTTGELLTGQITLTNHSRFPVFLIHLCTGIGFPRGAALSKKRRTKVLPSPTAVPLLDEWIIPSLRAGAQVSYQSQWELRRRGVHRLSPVRAGISDPLGLMLAFSVRSNPSEVVVLPRPLKIEQLGFLNEVGTSSQTPHHSSIVANALDFHGVRPWLPGEAIRRAHWKSTARTGRLHIIEWEDTPTADLAIIIDTHAETLIGEEDENSLEWSITAAATVINHLLENGSRAQLFYFAAPNNDDDHSQEKSVVLRSLQERNTSGRTKMLRALAELEPIHGPHSTLPALVEAAAPKIAPGLGVLLLTSARAPFAQAQQKLQKEAPHSACYALAFDVETEAETEPESTLEESGESIFSPLPTRIWHHTSPRIGRGMSQIVYGPKALAAILEGTP